MMALAADSCMAGERGRIALACPLESRPSSTMARTGGHSFSRRMTLATADRDLPTRWAVSSWVMLYCCISVW